MAFWQSPEENRDHLDAGDGPSQRLAIAMPALANVVLSSSPTQI